MRPFLSPCKRQRAGNSASAAHFAKSLPSTTHELMAISGHKTLTEVQRYTDDADRKRLAESGMAKRNGPSVNTELSNPAVESVKPTAKALK